MFNEAPFFENLRVGFHQVVRDVITCQILQHISSHPLNLKDNKYQHLRSHTGSKSS